MKKLEHTLDRSPWSRELVSVLNRNQLSGNNNTNSGLKELTDEDTDIFWKF